jgi:microcystin-dependent protein
MEVIGSRVPSATCHFRRDLVSGQQSDPNAALYSLLGSTYGGNGTTNFALPNLKTADPKGGGPAGVNYYICTTGTFP